VVIDWRMIAEPVAQLAATRRDMAGLKAMTRSPPSHTSVAS
jgi:hypothetical protein